MERERGHLGRPLHPAARPVVGRQAGASAVAAWRQDVTRSPAAEVARTRDPRYTDSSRGRRMARAKALKVRVEDRPGALGEIASALGAKGINMRAVHAYSEAGQGVLCIVVDRLAAANRVLAARGLSVEEEEILEVQLSDKPGTMGEVAKLLGDAGVNIRYVFVGTARGRKVTVFVAVNDITKALEALR